ncbi:hypothetical protein D3C83_162090 [compost metagenome]
MKVKKGIASSSSLESCPKMREGIACRNSGGNQFISTATNPQSRPSAESVKATG